MTSWTLIRRSLAFRARAHAGVVLGAAVGSAALVGALVVGDSVRESLREMALARLGRVGVALASNDRFFRAQLAADLSGTKERGAAQPSASEGEMNPALRDAAVLQLAGTASTDD